MKPSKFPIVLIITVLIFSCNDERSSQQARQQLLIPRIQYDSGFLSPGYVSTQTTTQNTNLPQSFETPTDPMAAQALANGQQNTAQPVDTAAILLSRGLNPPHGAPGHRCDLVVGAPLNSKPATNTAQASMAQANNTALKNGLNPAHGLPGHRCDIAVGAPLNSKPVTAGTNQNSAVATSNTTVGDSITVDSLKN